ncbi:MAG: gliding motility-associated C-terminal domain-containing protein [Saprospiraceae bacterium]|nr:gliding motility-associated C-terminal domain-containing protein [Saprospiraceae bacterium]
MQRDTVFFEGTAYTDFGLHEVIWQKGNGCDSTVQILTSEADETTCKPTFFNAYVPNAFSPNFDGINDFFMGNSQEVSFNELFIFERWVGTRPLCFWGEPQMGRQLPGLRVRPRLFYLHPQRSVFQRQKISLHDDVTLVR